MLANGAHVDVEQLGHQALRQPDRLILIPRFNAGPTLLGSGDKELRSGITDKFGGQIGTMLHKDITLQHTK